MKFPFLTAAISLIMVALYVLFGQAAPSLIWLNDHHGWQLISAHFIHISHEHLAWNLVAFIALAAIIEQYSKRDLVLALISGIVAVDLYLLFAYPLDAYAGLSGVLNSVLVVALFKLCLDPRYRHAAMLSLVISMVKIVYELHSGHSVLSSLVWPPVPQAHLVGWLAGAALMTLIYTWQNKLYRRAHKV